MSVSSFKSGIGRVASSLLYAGWGLGSVFGISTLLLTPVVLWLSSEGGYSIEALSTPGWTLGFYIAQYVIGFLCLLIVPLGIQRLPRAVFARVLGLIGRLNWRAIGLMVMTFVTYFGVTIVVQQLVAEFIPGYDAEQVQETGFEIVASAPEIIIAFLALVIMAPLLEELVFRGYIYGSIRPLIGPIASALLVSGLFGWVHGQWNVGLDVFVLSLGLCYLREKTGSIWASVGLHATKNGMAFFFLYIAPILGIQIQ